ncbi:hypothetical protein [Allofrancisella inopinata]|nr:hypothetical protein [Allofrancisella inopinata]
MVRFEIYSGDIENKLHWVLDVSMSEDGSEDIKVNSPENLAI